MQSVKSLLEKIMTGNKKIIILSVASVLLVGSFCAVWAVFGEQKDVTVSIDGKKSTYTTFQHTVGDFLVDENILLGENDNINLKANRVLEDDQVIKISRSKNVKIIADGETMHLDALPMSVGEALEQVDVTLDTDDIVTPAVATPLALGMTIEVNRIEVKEEVRETELAYAVEKQRDNNLSINQEKVVQEGAVGRKLDTFRVTYKDGNVAHEVLLSTKIQQPTAKIIAVGNAKEVSPGTDTESVAVASSGKASSAEANLAPNGMKYTDTFTVKATAYTHDGSKTKLGTECRVGAIAVDPSVIPLGTKLYVEGYGYCTAEDTGGKIKGNRIDIFLDTESECVDWGVRDVTIYILE